MSATADVLAGLLTNATIEVETAASPPFTMSLAVDPNAPPSPAMAALRPKVTVRVGGEVVYSAAPYGDPAASRPVVGVATLIGVALCVALYVAR